MSTRHVPVLTAFTRTEKLLIDGYLARMSFNAESAVKRLCAVKGRKERKMLKPQIDYWQNVLSGLRWARGHLKQIKTAE